MTQEEMERAFNFIIEHQAQFAIDQQKLSTDIAQLKDAQAATEQRLKEILEVQSTHHELLTQLTETTISTVKMVGQLAKAQKKSEEKLAQTDDRLNILINIVERYISNRNGNNGDNGN